MCVIFFAGSLQAAESDEADLSVKLAPDRVVKYQWTTVTSSETNGREAEGPFTFKADLNIGMTAILKGLPAKGPGTRVAFRIENYGYIDRKSLGKDVGEVQAMKGKIKVLQNGKTVVDSDNDIGLDEIKVIQQTLKSIEAGQMDVSLDSSGKALDEAAGEPSVVDTIRATGVEGMLRIVPGRTMRLGGVWEDSQSIPMLATFKLAKPVTVRSTSTFAGWETKDGKRLARIDIKTVWDPNDLKGDNGQGMLVEVSRVQGLGAGTCLFDPESGHFIEGAIEATSRYRIEGKKEGQNMMLDVIGKNKFTFKQIP